MTKFLQPLILAMLEATLVSLLFAVLTSLVFPWWQLLAITLLGWWADGMVRRLPPRREGLLLLLAALLTTFLVLGLNLGLAPPAVLAALLPGAPDFGAVYVTLAATLFLFWRGSRLSSADEQAALRMFGRGVIVFLLVLLLAPLFGRLADPARNAAVTAHLIAFVVAGLFGMAQAQLLDSADGSRPGWRWAATLGLAIALVVAAGIALTAITGGSGFLATIQTLLGLLILPFAVVGAALARLLFWIFGPLITQLGTLLQEFSRNLRADPQNTDPDLSPAPMDTEMLEQVISFSTWFLLIIPLLAIILLILFLRRRRPAPITSDEERESLGAWQSLGADMRDLLAGLRARFNRQAVGLRAALAALHGNDPSTRVRRAYLHCLLALEHRLPRQANQTPAEYASAAANLVDAQSIETLTGAYERARYNPAGATPTDADQADAALSRLEKTAPR
jgi:hypothetical protein